VASAGSGVASSRSSDALRQVVLLLAGFSADGEGVKDSGGESVADGFRGTVAEITLSENLHAYDTFAVAAHFFDYFYDGVGISVHVGTDGVKADEVDVDPGRCGSRA